MNEFFRGLGLIPDTRAKRWALTAILVLFFGFMLADIANGPDLSTRNEARREAIDSVLHASAIGQCKETILLANKRAKFGLLGSNVMTTEAGDVLVEQEFTVPVLGLAERDEMTARCVLRKNGRFEIAVS